MPHISRDYAPRVENLPGFERRYQVLGDHTVGFERYREEQDFTPLFKGLPDDRCQCPHWGVVLKGRLVFRYPDGEEVITAGQAYQVRPGHTARVSADTELIEFTPTGLLEQTMAVVPRNLATILDRPRLA